MVFKGNLEIDERGLIYESFRMDGITIEECRTIFFDWAIGAPAGDIKSHLQIFLDEYQAANPDHPMIETILDGMKTAPKKGRKGGRSARVRGKL